jgi:ATP-binding cassette subfamily B protein
MSFYAGLPFSFRYLIDDVLLGRRYNLLAGLIGGLIAAAIVVTFLGYFRDRLYSRLTASMLTDFRLAIFDHAQQLPLEFFSTHKAGELLACFSTDLASLETASNNFITWALLPGLDILMGTALMFVLDWRLAMIALLMWPVTLAGPRVYSPRVAGESYRRREADAGVLSIVQEYLGAQAVVKAFDLTGFFRNAFQERLSSLREPMVRVGRFSGLLERSAYAGIVLLQVSILAVGAYMVARGALTVGALAAFQALFLSSSYSLATITQYLPSLVEAMSGVRRIDELLERELPTPETGSEPIPAGLPEICFESVTFGYTSAGPAVLGLDFSIRQEGLVAIVGTSGSGKSTILSLLMRFYDPSEGTVRFAGVALRKLRLGEFRSRIGYVPQDSILFDLSIRENIRLGRADAGDAHVEWAARAAEIHDFIVQLPEGYETRAGERGNRLPGGQRQRLALARALIRDPAILILDESTSSLDSVSEAAVLATLDRLRHGRMILLVTHRLSSAVGADRILVMENGRLSGDGTHRQLLAHPGPYRRLWEKQNGFLMDEQHRRSEISVQRLRQVPVFLRHG